MRNNRNLASVSSNSGNIITIRDEGVPFDAHDLGALLSERDPHTLIQVIPPRGSLTWPRYTAPDERIVLRWNAANEGFGYLPLTPESIIPFLGRFQGEMDRLKRLGMPLLKRNVFLVKQDPHFSEMPVVYTAVSKHGNGKKLMDEAEQHADAPHVQRLLLSHAQTLASYHDVPMRQRVIPELGSLAQYAADGPLYDNDVYLSGKRIERQLSVDDLAEWTTEFLQPSPEQAAVSRKIEEIRERLYA